MGKSSVKRWLLFLLGRLSPGRPLAWVFDGRDERRARRLRAEFGARGWLVSWHRAPDGQWRARLSGHPAVRTIERSAPTRVEALDRAGMAMLRLIAFRASQRRCCNGPSALADRTRTGTD